MLVVEVGMKIENDLIKWHDIVTNHGLKLSWCCLTHDIYYTKNNLDGLTENEMKRACIRLRFNEGVGASLEERDMLLRREQELIEEGYKKVFDTIKIDMQYRHDTMKSMVQLQNIKDIGLLVYYDNPDYYEYPHDEQRKLLLEELNNYGFDFKEEDLGLDKLRTLYYGREMYSKNQNG